MSPAPLELHKAGFFAETHGSQKVYKAHRIIDFKEKGVHIEPQKAKLILLLRDPY